MAKNSNGKQLRSVAVDLEDGQVVIERLDPGGPEPQRLRLACWNQGKMLSRPPALTEPELVALLQKAVRAKILSPDFLKNLHSEFEI